jgi:hypothetical protein
MKNLTGIDKLIFSILIIQKIKYQTNNNANSVLFIVINFQADGINDLIKFTTFKRYRIGI